jgi:hypothetical protein
MHDDLPPPNRRRRLLLLAGGIGGLTLGAFGLGWRGMQSGPGHGAAGALGVTPAAESTVLAFIGALHGRDLSEQDLLELSDRLRYRLSSDAVFGHECTVLVRYLNDFAREQGIAAFRACDAPQRELIVQRIMQIDHKSLLSKLLSRLSRGGYDYYRMRWSTVWQLSWLYRQSGAAWRARGYARWPGVPGDWREILAPSVPYP